jgi:hypothetical protein
LSATEVAQLSTPEFGRAREAVRRTALVSHGLLAFCLSICVFYSAYLAHFHRILIPLGVVLFVSWISLVYETREPGKGVIGQVVAVALYLALILEVGRSVAAAGGLSEGINFERLTALFPLAAACGWLLVRSGRIFTYLRCFLVVGLFTVPLAAYEYLSNSVLFRATASDIRNGHTRAVVGSDHPLVLAALFLGLIPIAMYVLTKGRRLACVWLFIGILATGSNGPAIIGGTLLVLCLSPSVARVVTASKKPFATACVLIGGYLVVGSMFLWTTELRATNINTFSNEYRAGLYYLLPRILQARPLGYGLSGIPADTWYFSTSMVGIKDVAVSIDSELVYSAGQFGFLGVAFFVLAAVIAISALVKHHALGLAFLAITMSGLFLAIHCWDSLGVYWFFFGGACAAVLKSGDSASWTGLNGAVNATSASSDENRAFASPDQSRAPASPDRSSVPRPGLPPTKVGS